MANAPKTVVTVERRITASPQKVFDAFLDPSVARHFFFATTTGEMLEAETEPRVGGRYAFTERRPTMGDVRHVGEYLEIDRPRRLVFSFSVPQFGASSTQVAIDVAPERDGCVLTLTNEGVSAEFAERVREGWGRILDGLLPAYEGRHAAGWW
jgi:uncharacterized protein YndB with AHSA1/START domain